MYFNHSRMLCSFLPLCSQVARIETEKLLLQLLETELGRRAQGGRLQRQIRWPDALLWLRGALLHAHQL